MYKYLLQHYVYSLIRKMNPKTLPLQLLFSLFGFMILAYLAYNEFLAMSFIDSHGLFSLNIGMLQFFLLYSMADLMSRFFFQKLSSFNINPYILLLISKKKLSVYNEIFSFFQLYNLIISFFILSMFFGFSILGGINNEMLLFFLLIFLINLLNHSLIRSIKLFSSLILSFAVLVAVIGSLYFFIKHPFYIEFKIVSVFNFFFISSISLLLLFFGLTAINIKYYAKLFYLDKKNSSLNFTIPSLGNFTFENPLMALELLLTMKRLFTFDLQVMPLNFVVIVNRIVRIMQKKLIIWQ